MPGHVDQRGPRGPRLSGQGSLRGAGRRGAASMCPSSYNFAPAGAVPAGSPPGDTDAHEVQKTSPENQMLWGLYPGQPTFGCLGWGLLLP